MTVRRYVIMANGKSSRWGNYHGIPKHLITIEGETLLARTTRLAHECDASAQVVVSSSDARCETPGACRHGPLRNECEIDRFAPELVCDDVCFLYGDSYYTAEALRTISRSEVSDMLFLGSTTSVFAVRCRRAEDMLSRIETVRNKFLAGEIDVCKGWQLYQLYAGLPLGRDLRISKDYVLIEDATRDFNTPQDLDEFLLGNGYGKDSR